MNNGLSFGAKNKEDDEMLTKRIQNLPPELREKILREFIRNKVKERLNLGFREIHFVMRKFALLTKNGLYRKLLEENMLYGNEKRVVIGEPELLLCNNRYQEFREFFEAEVLFGEENKVAFYFIGNCRYEKETDKEARDQAYFDDFDNEEEDEDSS